MKLLIDALRSARKIEILLLVVMLCTLCVLAMGSHEETAVSTADSAELRLERILCQIEGAGRVSVMISRENNCASGCVIAASGADDVAVMLQMQRAAKAVTGLELDQIEIVKSKG